MLQNREKIDRLLQALRETAPNNNLDCLDEDRQTESNLHELVSEIAVPIKRDGAELDAVLRELSEPYPAADFWEDIRERVANYLLPYQETAFLREMEESAQQEYLLAAFEGLIRYREPSPYLCKKLNTTREQLDSTMKTYNTLINWVISERMSRRLFALSSEDFFGMSESMITFFWKVINDNRSMLIERTILSALNRTRQFVDSIRDLMMEGENIDEEDGDESVD